MVARVEKIPRLTRKEFDEIAIKSHRANGLDLDKIIADVRAVAAANNALRAANDALKHAQEAYEKAQSTFNFAVDRVALHVAAWPENKTMKMLRYVIQVAEPLVTGRCES